MNRPEYSLSLDSVICRRCSTVSSAEEDTCPSCGADRQGAVFTSRADTSAARAPAPLAVVGLGDTTWLHRMVRHRMLTSYPNYIEPDDQENGPTRKARSNIAILVGGVIASIATGGYFYMHLDDNSVPAHVEPGISVAGMVRDNAPALKADKADATRHAALSRARAEAMPASSAVARPAASAPVHAKPSAPVVVVESVRKPEARESVAQTATVKPVAQAPVVASVQKPETPQIAVIKPAPQAPVVASVQKLETPQTAVVKPAPQAPVVASVQKPDAPIKPVPQTPVVATVQKPEARESKPVTQAPVIASVQKVEPRETAAPAAKPQQPVAQAAVAKPKSPAPATLAANENRAAPAPAPVAEPLPAAVAHSIVAVQQALANRDLASARRQMRGLNASLPRSPEIQQLAADVARQERARDSAMATSRACAANDDPGCALRNARRAVSLDPRNAQTQATLRRALAVQNESNTEYFRQASVIPKATVPAMTFDGRWSAGNRHGPSSADGDTPNFTLFGLGVPTVAKGRGDAH